MKRLCYLFLLMLPVLPALSQGDSVAYSREFTFREGIFLTARDWKSNNPIPKTAVVSALSHSSADFMQQVMAEKYVTYKDRQGREQKLETNRVWGYCQGRNLYIFFNNEFCRVNVIGSMSHLVSTVVRRSGGFGDPMDVNYGIGGTYSELQQFVYNAANDKVYDFTVANMELLLAQDPALLEEFLKVKKRRRSDSLFLYLRRFNERHPLMISAL